MRTRTHRAFRFAHARYVIGVLLLAGCGDSHGTAKVTGVVLYKEQPVADATVNFLPKGDQPNAKGATGKTDSSGRFTLATYINPDEQPAGALPGTYAVTVTKIDEPQGVFDPHKDPPPKNHLPAKYGGTQQSPLSAEVKSSGRNHFEFKLTD
jgi:hypothetical protein